MNSEDNNVTMPLMDVKVVSTKTSNFIDMSNIKEGISNGVSQIHNKEKRVKIY